MPPSLSAKRRFLYRGRNFEYVISLAKLKSVIGVPVIMISTGAV